MHRTAREPCKPGARRATVSRQAQRASSPSPISPMSTCIRMATPSRAALRRFPSRRPTAMSGSPRSASAPRPTLRSARPARPPASVLAGVMPMATRRRWRAWRLRVAGLSGPSGTRRLRKPSGVSPRSVAASASMSAGWLRRPGPVWARALVPGGIGQKAQPGSQDSDKGKVSGVVPLRIWRASRSRTGVLERWTIAASGSAR